MAASKPFKFPVDVYRIIYNYMWGYDPEKHTLKKLIDTGNIEGVKWLIRNDKVDEEELEILMISTIRTHNSVELIELLMTGFKSTSVSYVVDAFFALAIQYKKLNFAEVFFKYGADIYAFENFALSFAVRNRSVSCMAYLERCGHYLTRREELKNER